MKDHSHTGDSPLDGVTARFDDLRADPVSLDLKDPYMVWATSRRKEVRSVIESAEREARSGGWVAGFVAYEAAPAFDDALKVREVRPGLPLIWFAAFREAVPEPLPMREGNSAASLRPEISVGEYRRHFEKIQELITLGDTYQTNYTLRLRGGFDGSPGSLYADFRRRSEGLITPC